VCTAVSLAHKGPKEVDDLMNTLLPAADPSGKPPE
jgi:hypothetical protein